MSASSTLKVTSMCLSFKQCDFGYQPKTCKFNGEAVEIKNKKKMDCEKISNPNDIYFPMKAIIPAHPITLCTFPVFISGASEMRGFRFTAIFNKNSLMESKAQKKKEK